MAKPKYTKWLSKDGLLKLTAWARDGLTDIQIANNMSINVSTLYKYKKERREINEALKKGKEVVDIEVENALLKRALGYTYDEVIKERNHDGELVITKIVQKEVQPDTTAQIFWLKNRKAAEWRDRQELEHGGEINSPVHEAMLEALKARNVLEKNE